MTTNTYIMRDQRHVRAGKRTSFPGNRHRYRRMARTLLEVAAFLFALASYLAALALVT